MKNDNRELIFLGTIGALALVQRPLEYISKLAFMKILPSRKFPHGSELRASKAHMLGERIFKVTMSSLCSGLLYAIMLGEDCDFLDVRIGGRTEHPLYFFNHPC
jgi:hypothetical protein